MQHEVVWVGYDKEKPHLPVCIADSAEELAKKMGVTVSTVNASWSRFWRGLATGTRYAMVFVDKGNEDGKE
jgi:hypothetical protein